jgi:hypothetical protein
MCTGFPQQGTRQTTGRPCQQSAWLPCNPDTQTGIASSKQALDPVGTRRPGTADNLITTTNDITRWHLRCHILVRKQPGRTSVVRDSAPAAGAARRGKVLVFAADPIESPAKS